MFLRPKCALMSLLYHLWQMTQLSSILHIPNGMQITRYFLSELSTVSYRHMYCMCHIFNIIFFMKGRGTKTEISELIYMYLSIEQVRKLMQLKMKFAELVHQQTDLPSTFQEVTGTRGARCQVNNSWWYPKWSQSQRALTDCIINCLSVTQQSCKLFHIDKWWQISPRTCNTKFPPVEVVPL